MRERRFDRIAKQMKSNRLKPQKAASGPLFSMVKYLEYCKKAQLL